MSRTLILVAGFVSGVVCAYVLLKDRRLKLEFEIELEPAKPEDSSEKDEDED